MVGTSNWCWRTFPRAAATTFGRIFAFLGTSQRGILYTHPIDQRNWDDDKLR